MRGARWGRRWRIRLIGSRVAAVTLLLGLGGGAFGDTATARVTDRDVRKSLRIAYDYWSSMTSRVHTPGYHCRGDSVEPRWFKSLGDSMASAKIGGCDDSPPTVNLERPTVRRLKDDYACAVIIHEFGHLLGYAHTEKRGSIMYTPSNGTRFGSATPASATWRKAYRRAYCGQLRAPS